MNTAAQSNVPFVTEASLLTLATHAVVELARAEHGDTVDFQATKRLGELLGQQQSATVCFAKPLFMHALRDKSLAPSVSNAEQGFSQTEDSALNLLKSVTAKTSHDELVSLKRLCAAFASGLAHQRSHARMQRQRTRTHRF
ncbi:MAG: hypothetical protein U1F71_21310 [Verrucomicrobiaceae bacterium]